MGLELIDRAFEAARVHRLTGHQTRLLIFMARSARDDVATPRYYASWRASARALGLDVAPDDDRVPSAVSRSVRALLATALIEHESGGYRGKSRVYKLKLPALATEQRPPESGDQSKEKRYPQTAEKVPKNCANATQKVGTQVLVVQEQEGAPRPTCKRHDGWDHEQSCRACAADRIASEHHAVALAAARRQELANRPPRLVEATSHERAQIDTAVRGFGTVPDHLQLALEEARRERNAA